ncbi:polysaccharide pyruvyl transferase family protein [Rossellomorea aquimaris]|uniref:Polysaccharide pyruvyl transferase n=1 Tax=Rossellomorea aquimaris TaxID=189382 RepID=A0A366ERZ5_9BACI|nr:polysaccharide pyruvyl transferase family protein [Rossellomorea aquimaris]RBP04716.1 polysaccharide pyruvyl transferase [Rossellomorea aquimaris]
MNKKVGIITLNGYNNYGNRLQNYALQETIKDFGYTVETVIVDVEKSRRKKIYTIVKTLRKIRDMFSPLKRLDNKIQRGRIENFKLFTNKYITETSYSINESSVPRDKIIQYEFFVVGSDQVWNPHYIQNNSMYFLTFVPPNKRVAYAPSFGTSKIPNQNKDDYRLWLSEMEHLSVREEAGAQIIKELTGRQAPVLIDPTLLVTREKWLSIIKPAESKPSNKYLLTYFLGNILEEDDIKIKKMAEEHGLEVVNLSSLVDRKRYDADPSEFLDYINSASIFLTDSFHGTIFSILLQKPFIVFNRVSKIPSMYSRIDTLLSKFNLKDRKWESMQNKRNIFSINFAHIPAILEEERKVALDYLRNALVTGNENSKEKYDK